MDVVQLGCIAGTVQLQLLQLLKKRRKRRSYWVHPTLSSRLTSGHFHVNFCNHRKYPDKFFEYYRMSVTSFDELLGFISGYIMKHDTVMRRSIEPAERLVLTLRQVQLCNNCRM